MDKKIELSIFGAVAAILLVVCIFALASSDKEGPVIKFDSEETLTYAEGQDDSVLLAGVTAVDKRDGDVTDTLFVAGKIIFADGQRLKVTYAAKDKHNNVTRADRIVTYVPAEDDGNAENNTDRNGEGSGENNRDVNNGQAGSDNDETSGQETTADNKQTVSTGPTGEIDKAAADASGIPVIKLKAAEGSVTAGGNFDAISYVRETYDNSGDVSRRIRVTGDYDLNKPGDYQLNYLVSDTEGNVSEPAAFTLHVLPKAENATTADNTNQNAENEPSNTENVNQNGDNANPDAGNENQNTEAGQNGEEPQNAN